MCGIFSAVGLEVSDSALENVFDVLHHRGPDGRGLFVDEPARLTLAHTRLAVLDLVSGAQPLHSDDGNLVLAANGEIYEFERIRKSLEAQGHRFATNSDSEIILYLYKQYGLSCFDRLKGEFAFLLYDRAKRLLIAARDRFGIKPLYFSRLPGGFVLASEMKAIFASGLVAPKLDVAALDPFVDRDPGDVHFPFEGIEQVPPASYLLIDLETLESRICSYWSADIPAEAAEPVSDPAGDAREAAAASVLKQLEEAVRVRLRADVPVGLYLSGGIDSAFVGALMQRNLDSPLHSFSISFEGSDRNEQEFARHAADFIGTRHHEIRVTRPMLWSHLEDCLWFSELPFVTLAPVGKFLLSREAKRLVTVVLTGEGADELFLGYRSFFEKAVRETRRPARPSQSPQLRRLKLSGLTGAAARQLSLLMLRKDHRQRVRAARADACPRVDPAKPLVNAVQEARIAAMPLDILCYLGDREEMAHSLEARLPFLDHRLYDTAKHIPVDFKLSGGVEKAVLRDAAKGVLPEDLRLRRKSGFMLTSDAVDLFGADRVPSQALRRHLSKQAFERAGLFSFRTYRMISLVARLPGAKRFRLLKRLRGHSNKAIMYMMQAHMLHDMFIADPRWNRADLSSAESAPEPEPAFALTA
jgi:asparagine synthase (glutamine-hydrolysing)